MAKEKTEAMIVALKAAKALVKESESIEDAISEIDGLLWAASMTKDLEN